MPECVGKNVLDLSRVMCIANNVMNLQLSISEGHELNTRLCEVRQELPLYYWS